MRILIPCTKLKEGYKLSIENAKRLLKDAELLFDAGSFPSAGSLVLAAEEEAAKAVMCIDSSKICQNVTYNEWKKKFKWHISKLAESMKMRGYYYKMIHSFLGEVWTKEEFHRQYGEISERMREGCLYVDWDLQNGEWKLPLKPPTLNKEYVEAMLHRAKISIEIAEKRAL